MSTHQENKNSILSMVTEDDEQCYEKRQTRFIIKEAEEKQCTIVHVPIKKSFKGLGLVVIQNGCFLQIVSIIEDGPADISGMLMPGDILVKIGKTNILGYKLRDLCDLIEKIPENTKIEVTVYRNYLELPDDWENEAATLKSIVSSPESDTGSSSEDDNNMTVKFNHFKPISTTWHTPSVNLPPVSRAYHHSKTHQRVLVVGPQADCDIIIHQSVEGKPNSEFLKHSPKKLYWSQQADIVSPSSSSSSSSSMDTFWDKPPSDERLHKVSPTLKKRNVNGRIKKYSKSKLPPKNPKSKPSTKAAILQGKHPPETSMTQISNLTKYH